jgi:hypothetical protein
MTLQTRIARTGYVVMYPAAPAQSEPERWFACDEHGVIQMRGNIGFNAESCRAMFERGALVEHVRLLAGAVIYRVNEVTQ